MLQRIFLKAFLKALFLLYSHAKKKFDISRYTSEMLNRILNPYFIKLYYVLKFNTSHIFFLSISIFWIKFLLPNILRRTKKYLTFQSNSFQMSKHKEFFFSPSIENKFLYKKFKNHLFIFKNYKNIKGRTHET